MDKTKISSIEKFENYGSDMTLIGYDTAANKVGLMPLSFIKSEGQIAGARWPIGDADPEGEPYGDFDLIAGMAEAFGLGGYLVQNDHTRTKLSASTHFKTATGATALLDGTMGHYQWGTGVPLYYAKWKDASYEYEAFSTSPIKGQWNYKIPVFSVSASTGAALDRTNNILVSYCNRSTQYRGGNNDASYDDLWNTMLGKPVVNVNSESLQTYAEKNGERWGASMFQVIYIVGALMRVFFHNRNIQASYNASLTADGCHQGGLGTGVDNVNTAFGNQYATVDIDALADKGDALGVFSLSIDKGDGTTQAINNIPCFFGLKNWYHYIWLMQHGILVDYNSDKSADVYIKKIWNSEKTPSSITSAMTKIGTMAAPTITSAYWIYPTEYNFEHLALYPLAYGGSTSQYYCDGFYHPVIASGLRGLLALGAADHGANAGSCCLHANFAPSLAYVHIGAALCEAAEDWDTTPFWVGGE